MVLYGEIHDNYAEGFTNSFLFPDKKSESNQ